MYNQNKLLCYNVKNQQPLAVKPLRASNCVGVALDVFIYLLTLKRKSRVRVMDGCHLKLFFCQQGAVSRLQYAMRSVVELLFLVLVL